MLYKFSISSCIVFIILTINCGPGDKADLFDFKNVFIKDSEKEKAAQKRWEDLAKSVGISPKIDRDNWGHSQHMNSGSLGNYQSILDELRTKMFAARKKYGRCSAINSFAKQKNMGVDGVDVYLMKYSSEGSPQEILAGLVSVPSGSETKQENSLIGFAHGGSDGISPKEIFKESEGANPDLVKKHVIFAPSYPQESVKDNKGVELHKSAGKAQTWGNDVESLQAMHHCLTRIYEKNIKNEVKRSELSDVDITVKNKLKLPELEITDASVQFQPKTTYLGVSRGALVAMLAAAREGSYWMSLFATLKKMSSNFGDNLEIFTESLHELDWTYFKNMYESIITEDIPLQISGVASLSGPSSLVAGSFKVKLAHVVKRYHVYNENQNLSMLDPLQDLFEKYALDYQNEGTRESAITDMRNQILMRDAIYLMPFILSAVRGWSSIGFDDFKKIYARSFMLMLITLLIFL